MFGFFDNFKNEAKQAFVDLHKRLQALESKVGTLFEDKVAATEQVVEHPVEVVADAAEDKAEQAEQPNDGK
jgi:hypothetical protein